MGDPGPQCNLRNRNNKTSPIGLHTTYGGIPQNLVTNAILTIILLAVFFILRKSAWKVVNKLVRPDEVGRWSHLFFSQAANVVTEAGSRFRSRRNNPHHSVPE